MLAAAAKADPMTGLVSHAPVLGGPSADPAAIAAGLQQSVGKSGLFYESHVAEWAQGTRPLAELAAEPQQQAARNADKPALTDPATAQFINLQLATHEQARIAWQGQLWPGQELRWEIARDAPERDQAGREAGDGDGAGSWQSSLKLRLGKLGEVAAKVVLSGGQLHIRLDAPESARELLEAGSARLAEALDAAGTPLTTLAILGAADADE
jgi:hypothetical protein